MSAQGLFLTLEGPDGSGKSTQFKLLVERLKRHGYKVKETREPGGPPLAEKIRALLLSTAAGGPTKEAELLLFLAARAQHVEQTIIPFLKKGYIVACERFSDSTYAYQVGGRGLPAGVYETVNRFATKGLKPGLTILLDINPVLGLKRAYQAKKGHDRMETETMAFARRVRQSYLALAKKEPNRIKVVKAEQDVPVVTETIWALVEKRLRRRKP